MPTSLIRSNSVLYEIKMQRINEKKRTEQLKNGAGAQEKKGNTNTGDEVCGEKKIKQTCGIFQDEKLLA